MTPHVGKRLLLVSSLYPTPDLPTAGLFVHQRVEALRASGVAVDVVAAPSYRHSALRRYLAMSWDAIAPRRDVDGVEAHVVMPAGLIGVLAAMRLRVPCLVYAHGSDVSFTAWRNPLVTFATRAVIRRAAAVVANSSWTAGWLRRLGGSPRIVPPGVDFGRFTPGPSERSALGLPDGNLALFVGNRLAHKGADIFVEGVLAAPGWRGMMVGDGPTVSDDERIITRAAVGAVELGRYYRSATCLVTPSRREGLGLVAIEAAATGMPVISSNVGGLADVVIDGRNGVVLAELSADALADALVKFDATRFDPETVRSSVTGHDLRIVTGEMAGIWADLLRRRPRRRAVSPSR